MYEDDFTQKVIIRKKYQESVPISSKSLEPPSIGYGSGILPFLSPGIEKSRVPALGSFTGKIDVRPYPA